jgi:hypothetical protein
MRRLMMLAAVLIASAAVAKPWQGMEPGASTREDVTKKFGEPSKVLASNGKNVLVYNGKEAIKGATEAHFRVDPQSNIVERIDVFPAAVIDKDTVESTYGKACPGGSFPKDSGKGEACYVKRLTDDLKPYFHYKKLGVVVFFKEEGNAVFSFVFQPDKPAK